MGSLGRGRRGAGAPWRGPGSQRPPDPGATVCAPDQSPARRRTAMRHDCSVSSRRVAVGSVRPNAVLQICRTVHAPAGAREEHQRATERAMGGAMPHRRPGGSVTTAQQRRSPARAPAQQPQAATASFKDATCSKARHTAATADSAGGAVAVREETAASLSEWSDCTCILPTGKPSQNSAEHSVSTQSRCQGWLGCYPIG